MCLVKDEKLVVFFPSVIFTNRSVQAVPVPGRVLSL